MIRWILIRMAVIVVFLALLIVACGPAPAPEVIEEVVKETVVVEKEVEVTKEVQVEVEKEVPIPESEVVTFMSWAEDDFEAWALEALVNRFEETQGIRVDLIFVR